MRTQRNDWISETDPGQRGQVQLNLHFSAWQAIPADEKLNLETENVILCEQSLKSYGIDKRLIDTPEERQFFPDNVGYRETSFELRTLGRANRFIIAGLSLAEDLGRQPTELVSLATCSV